MLLAIYFKMYRFHVYFVAILVWYAALAECKPYCDCTSFSNCCYPSRPVYSPHYYPIPPPISVGVCPVIHSCERFNPAGYRPCTHLGQCYATELCCPNPCYGSPTCHLRTDQPQIPPVAMCPGITSCKLYEKNKRKEATQCTDDNDCLRKEKCCTNPCENFQTCQEIYPTIY